MTKKQRPVKTAIIKNFDGDNVPEDFEFPSIGIEQIDRAVFDLFDAELKFEINSKTGARSVPVIFATGERFALTRRKKPIRDKNNANILPLISIVRENLDIGPNQGGKSTAISFRAQPGYYIKKRLAEKDRAYQNLLNKPGLNNQDNVATSKNFINDENQTGIQEGTIGKRVPKNKLQFSKNASVNIGNLNNNINANIFELIQVPYPYFISLSYNITFWCQYMQQGNEMIEYFLSKIRVPGGEFPIKTQEGFDLVAFVGDAINFENNFDSMTDDERIIKYSFSLTVPGYMLNSKAPGLPTLTRSFLSAPEINFSYLESNDDAQITTDYQPLTNKEKTEKHVLSNITTVDQLKNNRGESNEVINTYVDNPFSNDGGENSFLRIKNSNSRTGESVISGRIIKEIGRQIE